MHDKCGCLQGQHIWDTDYDKQIKSERFCICCEHFFLSEDAEYSTLDDIIDLPGDSKTLPKNPTSSGGLNKGKVRRRS